MSRKEDKLPIHEIGRNFEGIIQLAFGANAPSINILHKVRSAFCNEMALGRTSGISAVDRIAAESILDEIIDRIIVLIPLNIHATETDGLEIIGRAVRTSRR